jgi:hypothetical protein
MAIAATGALTGEAMQEVTVSLETPKATGALEEALTGEVKEEAAEEVTGKLKE